ncbi:NAD(P)H-dependent flavin oxidoreductase [Aeromonas diversa]|uniref:NAD(P)H-dependent flavin oxidoreductase n=1 Tax=Aeromonas diversa TaxID=502790 RepID=UPI0039A0A95C
MTLNTLPGPLPLIQAPMAGVQDHRLALAVCEAGAIGSLPAAMLSPDQLRQQLEWMTAHTDRPFNVNFFCHRQGPPEASRLARWRHALAPAYQQLGLPQECTIPSSGRHPFTEEQAAILADYRPALVSFHFGLPSAEQIERIKQWGGLVLSSATTVAEARWLEAHGADLIIAQGLEAGGHRGHFLSDDLTLHEGLFTLLPAIAAAVRLPVIAAGGIMSERSVRAALTLGARGVQAGTAFLLSDEATTSPLHRAALAHRERHTALTTLFTGRPARGLVNGLMRHLDPLSPLAPPFPHAAQALAPLRAAAEARGEDDYSPLWAGQGFTACRTGPAAAIVAMLAKGLESTS